VKLLVFDIVSNKHDNDRSFNTFAIIAYLGNAALLQLLHDVTLRAAWICPAAG